MKRAVRFIISLFLIVAILVPAAFADGPSNPSGLKYVSPGDSIADGIVASVNYRSAMGSRYSDKYIYIDIMGIETICEEQGNTLTDKSFLNNIELNVHPSVKGQQQIAEKKARAALCMRTSAHKQGKQADRYSTPTARCYWVSSVHCSGNMTNE